MELIPAIDLYGGKVVRLLKGRFEDVTVYSDDPVAEARRFADAGARRLHVVDLDGARSGVCAHAEVVRRIVAEVPIAVQVGGGIRTRALADEWLAAGAARVVLGTAALAAPDLVRSLARERGECVVVAIDARGGRVAVDGWTKASDVLALDLATEVDAWGAGAILFTDIDRDGTRTGPAIDATAAMQRAVRATVIASGGVGNLEDLRALAAAGVRAAVAGRAIYEGALRVEDAVALRVP